MQLLNPTRNVISNANALQAKNASGVFLSPETYVHSWTASNATASVVSEKYVHPLQYSLKLQPTGGNITFSLNSIIPEDEDLNYRKAQFHCQIFAQTPSIAIVELTNVTTSESLNYSQTLIANQWNAVFSPVVNVGSINTSVDDIEFSVEITIQNHENFVLYMSVPTLMNEIGHAKNFFVYNMRKFLPTFIWDKDKIQSYPNYPFTKLFHVLTYHASLASELYTKYFEYLNEDVSPRNQTANFRYSQLINPEHVDGDYVNWLSQFNGAPIYKSIVSTSSTETILNVDESISWQLANAYFGRNAGTLEAIKECAKQVLSGNKIVYVSPGGSFFQINVYTLLSETPGVSSEGDTSPEVIAMLELTKPMGFVINHEAYDDLPFILDDPLYGQLNTAPLG
jgi:hypothetical protein